MFKVFTKRHTMNTIAQEMLAMNTKISSFAEKLPIQDEFIFKHLYRLDKQKEKPYLQILYR